MNSETQKDVYDTAMAMCNDALTIADEAVGRVTQVEFELEQAKQAKAEIAAQIQTAPKTPEITLTKVATGRYLEVATKLKATGSFPEQSEKSLSNHLEKGGTAAQLEILEKLASRAVFDMGSEIDLGGSLVEKSTTTRGSSGNLTGSTAMWRNALDETDAELAGQR